MIFNDLLNQLENLNLSEAKDLTQKAKEELGYDLTPFARNFLSRKGYNFCHSIHVWKNLIPSNYQMIFDVQRARIDYQATHVYAPRMPFNMFQNPSVTHLMLNVNTLFSEDLGRMFPNLKFLCVCFSRHRIDVLDFIRLENCFQWSPLNNPVWSRWILGDPTPPKLPRPLFSKCVPFQGSLVPQELLINDSLQQLPHRMPTWIPK